MTRRTLVALALTGTLLLAGCTESDPVRATAEPTATDGIDRSYIDPSLPVAARVEVLLGQMTQVEEGSLKAGDVASLGPGSVLHGGVSVGGKGDLEAWKSAVVAHEKEAENDTRLGIPILYGVDAVHGFGSMYGATVFPQQIGLGAANSPELMTQIGIVTAQEMAAAGIRWNFSPVLAMPEDIRWGRTYETYSQDPAIVEALGVAYIKGLQGSDLSNPSAVLATAKHFVGDGATAFGSSTQVIDTPYLLDQGDTPADPELLNDRLLPPYQAALDAGVGSVMATYSSWGGLKVHGDGSLLTDTLRDEMGFTGFVVSDWAGCDQINLDDYDDSIVQCINAGVDMVMTPYDGPAFQAALNKSVINGSISQERIDEAVRRILTVKFEMDLFENAYPDPSAASLVGSPENRAVARTAVQQSQVLLKNDGALPIPETVRSIAVVGNAANDMGIQAGGWTQSWQGTSGSVIPGNTIWSALKERAGADVTVIAALPESGTFDVCVAAVG